MSDVSEHKTETAPDAAAIRSELDRILASRVFRIAEGQKNFLRYAVEESIEGRADLIKEYSIGTEVFHRGDSFNPREDNIVRAEARKLRASLAKYYETEGAQSEVRIELPKGSYSPAFRWIPSAETPVELAAEPMRMLETSSVEAAPTPVAVNDLAGRPQPTFALRWEVAAAVAGLILLLVGGISLFERQSEQHSAVSYGRSVAVLPFVNLNGAKEDEFFSDGLTEELIDSLGRVPSMHVVARASAFQFKGKTLDIRKIGQELNVGTVLEGSVRKYGNRVRITAQLDDTANGYRVWSESYDRDLKDTLAIQREISRAIATELGVELSRSRDAGSAKAGSGEEASLNPEAYQDYLKGLYFWNKGTAASTRTAITYFEQVIAKNPAYAPAYAGLARCYVAVPIYTETFSRDMIPKIRTAAEKALSLDNRLGEAHTYLAVSLSYEWDWKAAGEEFQKGLELAPGSAVTHSMYANYLAKIGRPEESLTQNQIALELDPVSPYMTQAVGRSLYYLRRYNEAIEQYQKALALDPNYGLARQGLGLTYLKSGMYSQGLAETEMARQLMGGDVFITGQLGTAYALSGNVAEAQHILNQLLNRADVPSRALPLTYIYLSLGDNERGFLQLRRAVDQRDVTLHLQIDPRLDGLRSDPRFGEMLRQAKLQD